MLQKHLLNNIQTSIREYFINIPQIIPLNYTGNLVSHPLPFCGKIGVFFVLLFLHLVFEINIIYEWHYNLGPVYWMLIFYIFVLYTANLTIFSRVRVTKIHVYNLWIFLFYLQMFCIISVKLKCDTTTYLFFLNNAFFIWCDLDSHACFPRKYRI